MRAGADAVKSKYAGVGNVVRYNPRRPWVARVYVDGEPITIGGFAEERVAALARDRMVLHYRLDGPLNFPAAARKAGPASAEEVRSEARRARKSEYQSAYTGVSLNHVTHRWAALLHVDGEIVSAGTYVTDEEAAVAHDRAARFLFGADARLNFPNRPTKPASPEQLRRSARSDWKAEKAAIEDGTPRSLYRGVSWRPHCGKWGAIIVVDGRTHYLGVYDDDEEAARVYDRAALALRGPDLSVLNFPGDTSIRPATLTELEAERRAARDAVKTSRYANVFRRAIDKWSARVSVNGEHQTVSGFSTEEAAAVAADRLVLHYVGRGGRLNFPQRDASAADVATLRGELAAANRRNRKSRFRGVRQHGKKWIAKIMVDREDIQLGTFESEEEAARAYARATLAMRPSAVNGGLLIAEPVDAATPEQIRAEREAARIAAKTSPYRGVSWSKNDRRWTATLKSKGLEMGLGLFDEDAAAATAYDRAARFYLGEAARLNFPAVDAPAADVETIRRENHQRFKATTTSRYKGVHWSHAAQCWVSQVTVEGRTYTLGRFDDEADAARAYDRKAWSLLGEDATLNFPSAERPGSRHRAKPRARRSRSGPARRSGAGSA